MSKAKEIIITMAVGAITAVVIKYLVDPAILEPVRKTVEKKLR